MVIAIGGLGDSQHSLYPWALELDKRHTPNTYLEIHVEGDMPFAHRVQVLRNSVVSANGTVRLIGQSAGGLAALIVASELPEKVEGVIAVSPAMPRGISPLGWPLLSVMWKYQLSMWQHKLIEVQEDDYKKIALNRVSDPELMLKNRQPISGREAKELSTPWLQPKLGIVRVPTIIVYGSEDQWVAPEAHRKLVRKLQENNALYTEARQVCAGHLPAHKVFPELTIASTLDRLNTLCDHKRAIIDRAGT